MNKIKLLVCIAFASMAFAACNTAEDNPVLPSDDQTTVNVDDPQEEVTDQPATVRN